MSALTPSSACGTVLLCAFAGSAVHAADWDLSLDVRGIDSNGRDSFLDGGQGKFRFDEQDSGLRLGRLRGGWTQPLGEVFSAHLDASVWADGDKNFVDLTELYAEYRPHPRGGFQPRVRAGAFFPPVSLENVAAGWETPYTLTPSAISSWIGEELRTIGVEAQAEWPGARTGQRLGLQLTGGVFGWNDPAGTLIAAHGFSFHDRQTTLFGRVGEPVPSNEPKREPFHEIDGRPGYYVGAQARYLDNLVLNVFHYDNRADPTARAPSLRTVAWKTRFDTVALRGDTDNGWSALAQWLSGETYIAPRGFRREWEFHSYSVLLAKSLGPHLLTARYDAFEVEIGAPDTPGNDDGHAWAVAYSFEQGANWRFTLEWLRVRSDVAARPVELDEPALAEETKIELAVRYTLSGTLFTGRAGPRATHALIAASPRVPSR